MYKQGSNIDIQDWHYKTFNASQKKEKVVHKSSQIDETDARARKADLETENFKVETVNKSVSKEIQQLRQAKQWSQKQLAQAINEKVDVVRAWENGSAIPSGRILVKMRKALK